MPKLKGAIALIEKRKNILGMMFWIFWLLVPFSIIMTISIGDTTIGSFLLVVVKTFSALSSIIVFVVICYLLHKGE